jgi:hypothetical protein
MEPVDTGERRLIVQCDLYKIMASKPHYKSFKGPDAQQEAKLFMQARKLAKRGYIEVVTELPKVVFPALEVAEDPQDAELARLAGELVTGLKARRGPDSLLLRRRLFALQRILAERLA